MTSSTEIRKADLGHASGPPSWSEGRVSRMPANASTWKYWPSAAKQDAEASRTRTARQDEGHPGLVYLHG
jgi:hypothetical protein